MGAGCVALPRVVWRISREYRRAWGECPLLHHTLRRNSILSVHIVAVHAPNNRLFLCWCRLCSLPQLGLAWLGLE